MAKYLIQDTTLTAIGDAIRSKNGYSDRIDPVDMPEEIGKIKGEGVELPELDNPAAAAQIRAGYEAIDANGAKIEGEMPTVEMYIDSLSFDKTNGKIIAGATVTGSGYVQQIRKTQNAGVSTLGATTIIPGAEDQVIEKHRWLTGDITIKAASLDLPDLDNPAAAAQIREGYEAINANGAKITGSMPDAVVTVGQPSIDGDGVASLDISCSEGYIAASQETISQPLPTLGATTIAPGTEEQVIGAHKWLTGDITVKGVALQEKTVTPGEAEVVVTPDADYTGLSKVTVEAVTSGGGGGSGDVRYVTFKNYDGTDIGIKPVAVGDDCRYIFGTPTKPSTAQYSYSHNGWTATPGGTTPESNALKAINEDKTLYATYGATVRTYTITYYDSDGTTVLKIENLAYGATPSYTPTKDGCSFDGWTPELSTVTGKASYTAAWLEVNETLTGTFASGAKWTLEVTGATAKMTLSGSGAMDDYTNASGQPWAAHSTKINALIIGSNITTIGKYAFSGCEKITTVTIPSKVTKIGDYAFEKCIGITKLTLNEGLTIIGFRAFYLYGKTWQMEAYPLGDIVIPSTVTQIWGGAFSGFAITGATFKNVSGWKINSSMTSSSGWTTLTEENLSNPATAANYLDNTYTGKYWKRS